MSGKAIRETLAALGVIASMIFVGLEIRQNTAVARMVAAQTFTQQQLDLNQVIMTEGYPELNTRMIEGALRQDFSSGDQLRLDATNLSVIRIWESLYRSVQLGIQDEEMLKARHSRHSVGAELEVLSGLAVVTHLGARQQQL